LLHLHSLATLLFASPNNSAYILSVRTSLIVIANHNPIVTYSNWLISQIIAVYNDTDLMNIMKKLPVKKSPMHSSLARFNKHANGSA
jgi:hypothetical protein